VRCQSSTPVCSVVGFAGKIQRNPFWIEREDADEKAFPRSRLDKIKKKRNFFLFCFVFRRRRKTKNFVYRHLMDRKTIGFDSFTTGEMTSLALSLSLCVYF
jgi:hypothetical protein